MKIREPRQINEFKVIDDHGNEYALVENQNIVETRSLKWLAAGQSWFGLADGTPVDKIDDQTFKIATNDNLLHRRTG
jgi:hypothetical protein